jgi:hypothetical protein
MAPLSYLMRDRNSFNNSNAQCLNTPEKKSEKKSKQQRKSFLSSLKSVTKKTISTSTTKKTVTPITTKASTADSSKNKENDSAKELKKAVPIVSKVGSLIVFKHITEERTVLHVTPGSHLKLMFAPMSDSLVVVAPGLLSPYVKTGNILVSVNKHKMNSTCKVGIFLHAKMNNIFVFSSVQSSAPASMDFGDLADSTMTHSLGSSLQKPIADDKLNLMRSIERMF